MVKHLTNPMRERPLPLGSLLSAAAQRLTAKLDRELAAAGFADLRSHHTPLFMVIDPAGTRPSDLARRAHLTKQAMGEQLTYLLDRGYLEQLPDPSDGRAKLVRLTERGWAAVAAGEAVVNAFDAWLDGEVGADQVQATRRLLGHVIEHSP